MKQNEVHIGINYPEYFEDDFEEKFLADVTVPNLSIKVHKVPPTVYASLEWAIPGLLAIYILKPYFESFLAEAGRDHFLVLKKWLKERVSQSKHLRSSTITGSQSTNKLDKGNTQSKVISVHLQTKNSFQIKLLFDDRLEAKDWEKATENFLDLTIDHYDNYPDDALTSKIKELSQDSRITVYAIIDPASKNWVLLNERMMILRTRNLSTDNSE